MTEMSRPNVPASRICGTETIALRQVKAFHLQISLCSYSNLWRSVYDRE